MKEMSGPNSVTALIEELQNDNSYAARQIFDRFIERLIVSSRHRLGQAPRRSIDEEDIAVAAFEAFFRGVQEKRFKQLANRDDLWQILVMLAERKAIGARRHAFAQKRGGGLNRGESVFGNLLAGCSTQGGIAQVEDPRPEVVDEFTSDVRELLELLDDETQKKIAILRLEGFTNQEIADQLDIALRSVERKLGLIRKTWEAHAG